MSKMGFFKSLKANMKESLGISSSPPSTPREAVCPPLPDRAFPPPLQVLPLEHSLQRYRKQRGVNLGAWFVTEGWLNVSLYRDVAEEPKGSDFDLARSRNKEALEKHWDTFIDEEDWKWMKERGFNSVRLPIGYYHLTGAIPEVVLGTDYEPYGDVFSGAWQRILGAIETAGRYGMGVMIDLHAAPGGQTKEGHSGMSHGEVRFWSPVNHNRASLALRFLASTFVNNPTVLGLEILNEPLNNDMLAGWYERTLHEIRMVAGRDFPVYIHDTWDMDFYCPFAGRRDDFVVVDHHLYRCYNAEDVVLTGPQHAEKLSREDQHKFHHWAQQCKGAMVIGEWSGGLNDWDVLPKDTDAGTRDAHKRAWVSAQLDMYEREMAGYYFWTLKSEEGWNAAWSAKNAAQAEILPASLIRKKFQQPAWGVREAEIQRATDTHIAYWNERNTWPDAAAFSSAFMRAWDDALMFLLSESCDELGFVWHWSRRRREEYEMAMRGGVGGLGPHAWQWDEGFRQGIRACTEAATVH